MDLSVIETERLLLRPLRLPDATALHPWMADAEVMRFWSTPAHADEAMTIRWVEESVAAMERGEGIEYAVLRDLVVIGRVALFRENNLGYFFGRPYWGQGYAREALAALIDLAFGGLALADIQADVDPRNSASLRLLKGLGFRQTGFAERTIEVAGIWCDSLYLELKADGWRTAGLNHQGMLRGV